MKHLHEYSTTVDADILTLSLAVIIESEQDFVTFASSFIRASTIAGSMVVDAIIERPSQRKITFDAFVELTMMLQDKKNASIIETLKKDLDDSRVCQWAEMIEQLSSTINLVDAQSIQSFLDELVKENGETKAL